MFQLFGRQYGLRHQLVLTLLTQCRVAAHFEFAILIVDLSDKIMPVVRYVTVRDNRTIILIPVILAAIYNILYVQYRAFRVIPIINNDQV